MKRKIASGSSVNSKSGATGLNSKITTQHIRMKEKALEEDPTIFQVRSIDISVRTLCFIKNAYLKS